MVKNIRDYLIIACVGIFSTFLLWLPFIVNNNFLTVYKHWDGPLYIIPAKSLYNQALMHYPDGGFVLSLPLSSGYFAAHLPLYPLFIRASSFLIGYLRGMVGWSVFFGIAYSCLLYYIARRHRITKHPLILALVSLFFTPRFFVIRSVGAPETLFMFLIMLSLSFFIDKKYWWASMVGALAALTKLPGVLLFPAYGLFFAERFFIRKEKLKTTWFSTLLIPFAVIGLFFFYQYRFGDFFKYFHTGAVVPQGWPFSVFNVNSTWVESAWLEDIYFIFLFYLLAIFSLFRRLELRPIFYFMAVFFVSIITVQHRDIARYSLPMLPFALFTFEKFFTTKRVVLVFILLLPALYLYAVNFMNYNVMPIADWAPFL